MANSAKKELRSFEASARNENIKDGFRFGGFGAASVWTYPIVIAVMFAVNAFTIGLPENSKNNAEMGNGGLDTMFLFWGSMVIGFVLALIGIFRVKGRFWSIPGALITWFLNPYQVMLFLLPITSSIPAFFDGIGKQLFGG